MAKSEGKNKLPPQNIDAEMSVLGAILTDEKVLNDVADKITDEDFYDKKNALIFAVIARLSGRSERIDLLTVTNELKLRGELDLVGGRQYIVDLTNYVPTAAHAESYAKIIKDDSVKRKIISMSTGLINDSYEDHTASELVEKAESDLFKMTQETQKGDIVDSETLVGKAWERIEMLQENKGALRGLPTGFADLDNMIGGLQPAEMIIIGARPSMGKSTFAQNLAYNISTKTDKAVLFFSLEMSSQSLIDRFLAESSGVDHGKIRSGYLNGEDIERISEAMGTLSEANLSIDDTPGLTVGDIRAKARRFALKNPLGVIIVDYIGFVQTTTQYGSDMNHKMQEISYEFKQLAKELNIPIVVLSQLSRGRTNEEDKRPQLQDLRDSGAIEQDADVVMFIHREEYYHRHDPDWDGDKNEADLIIAKNRNGRSGPIKLYFHPELLKFQSVSRKEN